MSLESNFTISQRADTAIRRAATVVLLVVGISSAILSYAGLRHLAIMAGIADSLSFLFPIVVDGMILLGSLSVLRAALARMPTWFGWMLTILGTVTSIAGNILSVENANLVSQVIHSVPPVFLCLSLETFIQLLRHRIKNTYESKNTVASNKDGIPRADIELPPAAAAPSPVVPQVPQVDSVVKVKSVLPVPTVAPVREEAPARKETLVIEEAPIQTIAPSPVVEPRPVVAAAPVVAPTVVSLPAAAVESAPAKVEPVIAQKPTIVEPVAKVIEDAAAVSKPVESAPAPATPVAVQKPVPGRPTPARAQPSAAPTETVELYRIILENLDDELTKTQRIAEILRVYPDAKIGDLREALGDEPTLRIDGSVRRAKELLKSVK